MSGRKVVKRACDGCKIRKIKCSEVAPCEGCIAAGIACTFIKHPAVRGPRKLRRSTLQEISDTQQQWERLGIPQPSEPVIHTRLDSESVFAPAKIAALVLQLCVYRLRVYPIWPIIKVERLVASLQKPEPDIEVFALAYAVAAATIIRIKADSTHTSGVTAEMMEAQCQYAKVRRNKQQAPDLTTVRIPFFLHIYYETLDPGGLQSITYLREAIAVAHMIGLHRESYYENVQPEEQEIRRRTLWLLFVTERGVSIKHKLPVTIKTKIKFPSTVDTDEHEVLLAYQRLISMFWHFDQSGVFELLDGQDFDLSRSISRQPGETEALASVRKRLDDSLIVTHDINGVQALDIVVTRHWMRIILWRLAESHGFFAHAAGQDSLGNDPISIAGDLLETLKRADRAAIEAHGAALDTKIFEIASTVADAYTWASNSEGQPGCDAAYLHQAREVLLQLQQFLLHNSSLAGMLQSKISKSHPTDFGFRPGEASQGQDTTPFMDAEIERQLQAHGFHFTEPTMGLIESPGTDSMAGDVQPSPHSSTNVGISRLNSRAQQSQSPIHDHYQPQMFSSEWGTFQGDSFPTLSPFNQMLPEMDFDFNSLDARQVPPSDATGKS